MTNPEKAGGRTLAGKCLCGAVHYAVADEFVYAANCHCSNCRRATGSAFKPFAGIERDKLAIAGGSGNLMIYGDENGHDAHCKVCGSLLYSVVRDGAFVHVPMGTLIDDPTIRPTAHIFVGSKARWFTITDDLPNTKSMWWPPDCRGIGLKLFRGELLRPRNRRLELLLTVQPDPATIAGSSRGPVPPVTRGKGQVIVIFTDPALIDRISPDCRRIEILQDDMSTVSAHKIVATSA